MKLIFLGGGAVLGLHGRTWAFRLSRGGLQAARGRSTSCGGSSWPHMGVLVVAGDLRAARGRSASRGGSSGRTWAFC